MADFTSTVATLIDPPALSHVPGSLKHSVTEVTITGDTYNTGGFDLTPAQLGLTSVYFVSIPVVDGFSFAYDYENEKVLAYWVDTTTDGAKQAEVADSNTALDGVAIRVFAIGK